ncbi:MAG TPA: MFS transporter [Candidatus Binatia bacterium]|jgi:MFS family permease|nr:MFS transporter [Candidatus Binatia bacterium]
MLRDRPLFILSLAIFSTMLGNGIVVPFLPLYAQQFGATGLGAGFLFSAHSAARTFLLPAIGRASDRRGRKEFLLAGLLFYALSSVAFLLANSMMTLLLIMAFQGIATAMVQPVTIAYVGDLTPKGKEGAYSGYINTAFLGGVAGGPLLGGMIKDLFNMQAGFLIMGVLSLLSFFLLLFFLPEARSHKALTNTVRPRLRELLASRPIAGVACFRLGYAFMNAITWVFIPLLAARLLSLKTAQIGLLISLNVIVSTILQAPCGRLADRLNKASLIGIGGVVAAVAFSAFPLSSSFLHLVLLSLLTGAASGLAFPAHVALAMENARDLGMGTVMSWLLTVHSFGMMVGPVLFGFIADHYSLGSVFYGGGLIGVLVTGVCYVLTCAPPSESPALQAEEKEAAVVD